MRHDTRIDTGFHFTCQAATKAEFRLPNTNGLVLAQLLLEQYTGAIQGIETLKALDTQLTQKGR